jgi:predicted helicase
MATLFESQPEYMTRRANLAPGFIAAVSEQLGLEFMPTGKGDLQTAFGPEDVFHYIYAIFHSPTYRERYAEFLKTDFPRVPLTSDLELFRALAAKGEELAALHLLESPSLEALITQFPADGDNEVTKVWYQEPHGDTPGRVYVNKTQYFEGVPPELWEFQVGGYQVCEKWLKDRRERRLSGHDVLHYQQIVVALKETIRLMGEIDEAIPDWPIT